MNIKANGNITASNMLLDGTARAINFSEKVVEVTTANSGAYFENQTVDVDGTPNYGVRLLYDGSGGGEVVQHMILSCGVFRDSGSSFGFTTSISSIAFPMSQSGQRQNVTLTVNHDSVAFMEGTSFLQPLDEVFK